jgi:hypothetical protein
MDNAKAATPTQSKKYLLIFRQILVRVNSVRSSAVTLFTISKLDFLQPVIYWRNQLYICFENILLRKRKLSVVYQEKLYLPGKYTHDVVVLNFICGTVNGNICIRNKNGVFNFVCRLRNVSKFKNLNTVQSYPGGEVYSCYVIYKK